MSKLNCSQRCKPHHIIYCFALYVVFLPFQPWVIAEITTPIRAKMIEDSAIQIYIKPEEWRQLRGIQTVATPETPPLEWEFLRQVEHSDVTFPTTIEFENRTYNANFIDSKTKIILYYTNNEVDIKTFGGCIFDTRYYLYYDPIIHQVIASVKDVYGLYLDYFSRGNMSVGDRANYSKLTKYLEQHYNF